MTRDYALRNCTKNALPLIDTDDTREHFSARIREDIINGVVPKTYFVLQGKLHPVQLKISEIDLPEEVKNKIEEPMNS